MPGLLDTAVTGLRVSQSALRTTGHNIANANTDGFSRQHIEVATNTASFSGSGYIGNGASVTSVQRTANEFVTAQLRTDTSLAAAQVAFSENIRQLDTLLSDTASGLSSALDSFFSTLQNAADDPTSVPARQLVISEAENLATRFHSIYERFESMNESINAKMEVSVAQINALSSNIAQLNVNIAAVSGASDNPPNDLLDQRDEALRQLSELVSIQTFEQDNQVNVIVGGGQSLVISGTARELTVIPGELDASQLDIAYNDELGAQSISDRLSGGEVGGLLEFRDSVLAESFNELGRIAMVMASNFNDAHAQGIDLSNNFGGNFFRDVNDPDLVLNRVSGSTTNSAPDDRVISLEVVDSGQITSSNYSLEITSAGGLYRIIRESDGAEVAAGSVSPGSLPQTIEFDGLRLGFQDGSFQNGDSFLIQPTRTAARDFETVIARAEELAFASPLATNADLGNTGSGEISAGELLGLVDANGDALPTFANRGEMNPPLVVVFTSPTTYDVMDNSDPSNPAHLDPPLRNQVYTPGFNNPIFTNDIGETMVAGRGAMLGLPAGSAIVTQASVQPGVAVPNFAATSFNGSGDQFSFDVVVSGTGGVSDGTTQVTINSPAIVDNASLLADINDDLAGSGVTAYINDGGALAFKLDAPGGGDVTLNNYDADPDGGLDNAPAGQANTLLGFNIEGANFTTVGDADGTSGVGSMINNYTADSVTFSTVNPTTGAITSFPVFVPANSSARDTASLLGASPGVTANARNYMEISNLNLNSTSASQITLNGVDLLEHGVDGVTGAVILSPNVPDPALNPAEFNQYLAEQINSDPTLQALGIHAQSATDSSTGKLELRIFSSKGDDFNLSMAAAPGDSIDVSDGTNDNLELTGTGVDTVASVVVGGTVDVTMASDITMITSPAVSGLFGDSSAANFSQSTYLGIQAQVTGNHEEGDKFYLDFNTDGVSDNRNALRMDALASDKTVDGGRSTLSENYAKLVEEVGIETSAANINGEASLQVLQQTTDLRNSISAVNLDEEAANLILFEQIYNANAQVISVARDLFDRLISIF